MDSEHQFPQQPEPPLRQSSDTFLPLLISQPAASLSNRNKRLLAFLRQSGSYRLQPAGQKLGTPSAEQGVIKAGMQPRKTFDFSVMAI